MATRSISYHLGLPVFIAAAALLALAAGLLFWSALVSRYVVERGLREAAHVLSIAVEREAATWTASLHALAAAPPPGCRASQSFHAQAKAVAARHEGWIVLADGRGQQRMNTLLPLESPLPPANLGAKEIRPAFSAARPVVSDIFDAPLAGTQAVAVAVALKSAGETLCWLSMGVPLRRFAGLIKPVRSGSWTGVLMDSTYAIVASSRDTGASGARRAPEWYARATRGKARGLVTGEAWPESGAMRVAFERVNDGRWTVAVAAPRAQLQWAWMAPLAAGAAGSLLIIALSVAAAAACARRVKRQMSGLVGLAARIGGDASLPAPPATSIAEIALLGRTLVRADEAVRQRRIEHELHLAAESAGRSKDLFLAMLSHELRGTLTAVVGWLDVARSSLEDRRMLLEALDIAQRNARQQARMIEDLLDVSRIVAGKLELQRQPVELARLAREALDAWRPTAEQARVELRWRLQEPVFIEGDRARMLQVLGNLLGNAIKFNRAGGWVELALEQRGREARLAVADNGEGIAQPALAHIFERFWQAETAARRRHAGLGLGLPLVHFIVEKHGGRITAESAGPGRGARFTVRLPALLGQAPTVAPEAARAGEEAGQSLYGLGVVALDEDRDTLGWLQHLFAAHGAATWVAHSVEEAIALVARVKPDVLISGMAMTGREGDALIGALRALHPEKRVAALAFSADPTDEERGRALAAGYDGFVAKPCEPGALLRAVKAVTPR